MAKPSSCLRRCWQAIIGLFIFITFLSSLISPTMAIQPTVNPVLLENVNSFIRPLLDAILDEQVISDLERICLALEHNPEFLNDMDSIFKTIQKNGSQKEEVQRAIETMVEKYFKKHPHFLFDTETIIRKIDAIAKNHLAKHPLNEDGITKDLRTLSETEKNPSTKKQIEITDRDALDFLRTLGIEQYANPESMQDALTAFYYKRLEASIKATHSINPMVRLNGVISLGTAWLSKSFFNNSSPSPSQDLWNENFMTTLFGKGAALAWNSNEPIFARYIVAKIIGEAIRQPLSKKGLLQNSADNYFDITAFGREFVVGYIELSLIQQFQHFQQFQHLPPLDLVVDACDVAGLTAEMAIASYKNDFLATRAAFVGAIFNTACQWKRYRTGMDEQRRNLHVPATSHLCLSQLDENGTSRLVCTNTEPRETIMRGSLAKPGQSFINTNINDRVDVIFAAISATTLDSIHFVSTPQTASTSQTGNAYNNAFTVIGAGTGARTLPQQTLVTSLTLQNNEQQPIDITKITPDNLCYAQNNPTITPNGVVTLSLTGCEKGHSYVLPVDYIVRDKDPKKDKYLHGLICFMVEQENSDSVTSYGSPEKEQRINTPATTPPHLSQIDPYPLGSGRKSAIYTSSLFPEIPGLKSSMLQTKTQSFLHRLLIGSSISVN